MLTMGGLKIMHVMGFSNLDKWNHVVPFLAHIVGLYHVNRTTRCDMDVL